jgi:hypothetical protein
MRAVATQCKRLRLFIHALLCEEVEYSLVVRWRLLDDLSLSAPPLSGAAAVLVAACLLHAGHAFVHPTTGGNRLATRVRTFNLPSLSYVQRLPQLPPARADKHMIAPLLAIKEYVYMVHMVLMFSGTTVWR